ncbi:hypothetical protein IFM58399_10082 [Aspergillus lentulus]|uniref:putative transcription factor n=1 Tax=Aspergillus lentulus TaxID=293939 RepID=UPI0013929A30|nr:uncharacterized protein IFM58399_10082 [Aspergillus lentulus]GFF55478.1 hypothetical protein IFM58399_10082 [Aspergillus lentulus]GFF67023.1 hypothetical protein IFM62136_06817 [Aspergillus lentulus]
MRDHQETLSKPLRRERLKISIACQACRSRKAKCDGGRPACTRCVRRGKACTYNTDSSALERQAKRKTPVPKAPTNRCHIPVPASSPNLGVCSLATPLTRVPLSRLERVEEDQEPELDRDQSRAYYSTHGQFAGEVAAAIDVRAGLVPAATSNLVPFVDAPLFGVLDLHSPYSVLNSAAELPPHAHADRLVCIYWEYVDPLEPVLSRERFVHDYEATYSRSGALLHADRDVWLSILNVVFALAVQRQESILPQQRDEEGNRFFQRAWALLRPETILWKPGTLELVQCLMLMNRYLHCTSNQLKTWMTAGLAIRIAQSMCCHLPVGSSAKHPCNDTLLKQKVWAGCVALDRCVSWSLGRTSAPSLIPLPNRADAMSTSASYLEGGRHAEHLSRELHEIGNQIQLAQTQTRNPLAARLGLPRLYQQDDYHAVAVQLDACLNKWENGLPSDWKLQNLGKVVDRASRAERYVLHLRLLHSRIVLYRPMLARLYSLKSHPATIQAQPIPPSLSDRLLRECAGMCVETAQKLTSLIIETLEPNEPMGLLPWWYRVYYLHIAGTNFLAAMFDADLFTTSVSQSWRDVLSALRAHEHLSMYVQQCIRTFELLSTRILETQYPPPDVTGGLPLEEATSGSLFDHIFQDLGFDCNSLLFGMEDFTECLRDSSSR